MKYIITSAAALVWTATTVVAQSALYGQCGGIGWTGSTTCSSGVCTYSNAYYSQCLPGTATTTATSTATAATTSSAATPTATLSHTGVNIAGFDFGCDTTGTCTSADMDPPTAGATQMQHFVSNGMNTFRLPIGWQYIQPTLNGTLSSSVLSQYDSLVQACLATGAWCIIDIHNYARWNGNIIGQSSGAVTNGNLANLWSQIAAKYASQSKIIFGVMNEPHDVPDINAWAVSVQAAVTAIRSAGATSQIILLPGNNYTSAQLFVSNGSAAALSTVKNLDGSITNLIFDVHKYLDSDNSGTHSECTTDNVADTFTPLATYLRSVSRQAFLTETGGGNVASCVTDMCSQNTYIKANSDVFLGYLGWAAGSFLTSYILSETPTGSVDQLLVSSCMYQNKL
ncbi:Endoglucanase EG-II [Tulasnella sp. JGI-2019a]|nr:Endoglucanase EG-II [Tulasnella sp. JGI-2019a]KAG9026492.1 Endoglucanase EG-II [Tulasnella sp. JGI-2019a]